MELTFNKVKNGYVAEFEATADFNIHLEREKAGMFDVYQRTSGNEYALIDDLREEYAQQKRVIDYDFTGIIYPKMIKVVLGSNPTMGIVTFAE